jgi:DNA-binding phage protein
MKQTDQDRRFAQKFAAALLPHITRARNNGKSLAEIATELGVTAAGLQKQLTGGTPSIRTVAFAFAKYGVSVPYAGVEVARAISRGRKRRASETAQRQLFLPFEITIPPTSKNILLMPVRKSVHRYRLQLTVAMSS